jgi:ABC-type transport system involved in cytochrome c biogenesis permease subunit
MLHKNSAITKGYRNPVALAFIWAFVWCSLHFAARANSVDLGEFGRMSIQHEGRVKPLDTYARSLLLQFSSRSSYEGMPAIEWLADLLFDPERSEDRAIFRIQDPQTLQALGLKLPEARRYSFRDLSKGMSKLQQLSHDIFRLEEKERSPVDQELLRLHFNLNVYQGLTGSLRFAREVDAFAVHHGELAARMGWKDDKRPRTYLEMRAWEQKLNSLVAEGTVQDSATAGDTTAANASAAKVAMREEAQRLAKELFFWKRFNQDEEFNVIPPFAAGQEKYWTPWQILAGMEGDQQPEEIGFLANAAKAYRAGQSVEFQLAMKNFSKAVGDRKVGKAGNPHGDLEVLYNKVSPFKTAKVFYLAALLTVLASLLGQGKWIYRGALILMLLGFLPHAWGIITRMVIMSRPPITNLFETFITVSWVCCLLGLVTEWFQRNRMGLIIAAFSATALLFISDKYASEGDTLSVLVAVLDTHFWLSTHVVTISLGYAGCCAAGIAGHLYLIQKIAGAKREILASTFKSIYGILGFGLVFSFIGTVLGGIWADQSWGRFWGWDPKENGALLIVLWCAVLFHARMGGRIREVGLAVGSVIGITVVLFAWFGINLLGVGLHSYGFSSGVFFYFILFIAIEAVFILVSLYLIRYHVPFQKQRVQA